MGFEIKGGLVRIMIGCWDLDIWVVGLDQMGNGFNKWATNGIGLRRKKIQ